MPSQILIYFPFTINIISMKKYKYYKVDVSIPSGTTATTIDTRFNLDKEFETIEGVQAIVSTSGGIPNFSIGLKNSKTVHIDIMDSKAWDSSTYVAPKDQYLDLGINVDSDDLFVQTQFDTTLTAPIKYQFIFKLSKTIS
jgi:hypothetical protein